LLHTCGDYTALMAVASRIFQIDDEAADSRWYQPPRRQSVG
jgi:hypothetical protein